MSIFRKFLTQLSCRVVAVQRSLMVLLSLNSWLPQYSWCMDLFTLLSMMNLIIGVSIMKTGTAQNLTALSLLAFVLIALPVQALAADHDARSEERRVG